MENNSTEEISSNIISTPKGIVIDSNWFYNNEPVFYCAECLSLRIRPYNDNTNYCDDCGSTDILTAPIEVWEKLYEAKYGKKYINK